MTGHTGCRLRYEEVRTASLHPYVAYEFSCGYRVMVPLVMTWDNRAEFLDIARLKANEMHQRALHTTPLHRTN